MGAALAAVTALAAGASPIAAAQYATTAAPKAYVGLFGDNAVAVIDTARNQVTKTIPIPTGPHGLVITPDNKWVYASSDGDSVVSVINTATDEVTATIDAGARGSVPVRAADGLSGNARNMGSDYSPLSPPHNRHPDTSERSFQLSRHRQHSGEPFLTGQFFLLQLDPAGRKQIVDLVL